MPPNDGQGIKTTVNLRAFEAAAADRVPMGIIAKENGLTITRMGMDGKQQTFEGNAGDKIYKGDVLKTPEGGSFSATLADKTVLSGGSGSTVDISKFALRESGPEGDEVKRGSLSVISGKIAKASPDNVSFASPGSSGGVRG